ncbi:hypothetical protein KIN20_026972 [Parelaphostrongylus tenuis]|uniref:Uncharacterized protein n=1 Tax=Parelaphostrongylus tenuis TaxID=148309 RepID=A0AAD5WDB1_PARTN|nr:hypothetical protein KIN20_026972 [Parelaphostrongylus tenuis]
MGHPKPATRGLLGVIRGDENWTRYRKSSRGHSELKGVSTAELVANYAVMCTWR